jgi:hypothetical protein
VHAKCEHRSMTNTNPSKPLDFKASKEHTIYVWDSENIPQQSECLPGQHFHIDYGFMKGSEYHHKKMKKVDQLQVLMGTAAIA